MILVLIRTLQYVRIPKICLRSYMSDHVILNCKFETERYRECQIGIQHVDRYLDHVLVEHPACKSAILIYVLPDEWQLPIYIANT